MKTDVLRTKSKTELQSELLKSMEKMQKLRRDVAFNKLKNVREIRQTRTAIARLHTLLNEK